MIKRCCINLNTRCNNYLIMGDTSESITKVVVLAIAVIVGITLFADATIPIVIESVGNLTGDNSRYNTLLYLLPMIGIFAMMVIVVRYFTEGSKR